MAGLFFGYIGLFCENLRFIGLWRECSTDLQICQEDVEKGAETIITLQGSFADISGSFAEVYDSFVDIGRGCGDGRGNHLLYCRALVQIFMGLWREMYG